MASTHQRFSELRCPSCEGRLRPTEEELLCSTCAESVPILDGVPRFAVPTYHTSTSRFFDALSSIYETPLWFPVMYRLIGGPFAPLDDRERVTALLELSDGTILDVACGTGRFTRYLTDRATFVWGIDVSDAMLETARRYATRKQRENVAYARMDANDLRFQDDHFDGLTCCWALHLFPDSRGALAEFHRVIEPGGRFAGTTLTNDYVLAAPGMQAGLQRTVGARVFEERELRDLLAATGFERMRFERHGASLFFAADG